jgi:hypothetical protein
MLREEAFSCVPRLRVGFFCDLSPGEFCLRPIPPFGMAAVSPRDKSRKDGALSPVTPEKASSLSPLGGHLMPPALRKESDFKIARGLGVTRPSVFRQNDLDHVVAFWIQRGFSLIFPESQGPFGLTRKDKAGMRRGNRRFIQEIQIKKRIRGWTLFLDSKDPMSYISPDVLGFPILRSIRRG